jgi:hypothetical protein
MRTRGNTLGEDARYGVLPTQHATQEASMRFARHMTKIGTMVGTGLIGAAILCLAPTATASDGHDLDTPIVAYGPEFYFPPDVYSVRQSITSANKHRLDVTLGQGKSFTYIEGQGITVTIGATRLNITIYGDSVKVGNDVPDWCSSGDPACIVHAIRNRLKGLTIEDATQGFAAVERTLSTMQGGDRVARVFYGLATMPMTQEDEHKDKE